jgi:geranylgeranyl pyrophosphate synthase
VNNTLAPVSFFALVQDRIRQVEKRMRNVSDGHHPDLKAALEHLLSSGGKRVRPTVALLMGEMLGANSDKLITLAAALELLHTATLVHDDLIDGSFLRRGIPTLNSQWTPAATVLTGDYIFACAARLAAETGSVEVMHRFSETLATIVNGEINQMFSRSGGDYLNEYLDRIHAKTASMFVLATTAASLLSPSCNQTIDPARRYGYAIGMAFQIIDDVLDFTAQEGTIGKPVASDLRHGLITLPAIFYLKSNPDNRDMGLVMKGVVIGEARTSRLISSILESDAIQESVREANLYIDQAMSALAELPDAPERRALQDLSRYVVDRHQ